MSTILVLAYFADGDSDAKSEYFRRLNQALKGHGHELYLINLNGGRIAAGLRGESLPFLIEKSHKLPLDRLFPVRAVADEIRHAASLDAACWRRSPAREELRVALFREYLRSVILREKPGLAIAWHQFFGLNYSLPSMLRELGVPFLFAEYGPLPGTIIYDEVGQMAESPVAQDSEAFLAQPVSDQDVHNAAQFVARVRSERRSRKPQRPDGAVRDALRDRTSAGRRVVFYAGQYDIRTGMTPRTLPHATLHSPYFSGTMDGLSYLSGIARANDWTILFKPHPLSNPAEPAQAAIGEPGRVVTVRDASIFECFDVAAATVTIVSQVSYMSLIYGRPCVLLGRNYLSGKGCAYEPSSRDAVAAEVRASLIEGMTEHQNTAWLRHVAQLMKYSVFSFDGDLDADGLRGDAECAAALAAYVSEGLARQEECNAIWNADLSGSKWSLAGLKAYCRIAERMRLGR